MSRDTDTRLPRDEAATTREEPERAPDMLRDSLTGHGTSEHLGPPNAESHGVWRILRNSLLLALAALGGAALVYAVS